jgi:hypothetical protein
MNIVKILAKYFAECQWNSGDTYDSLEWYDKTTPKPTQDELNLLYNQLLIDDMREERNYLLKESDYTVLQDFPTSNKQAWLDYRQQLRDFPSVWNVGVPFPLSPIS